MNRSDAMVVPYLSKMGILAEATPWDDPYVDWRLYDAVILRSCWNYHEHSVQFQKWITNLHKMKVRMWNPQNIILWNIHKSYLFELESRGIRIIPSHYCSRINLDGIRRARAWDLLIIKPVVGATASHIKKFSSTLIFLWLPYVWYLLLTGPVIIQKYMASVIEGEYSLIFFDKKYSHAVKKIPKTGDFRSQEYFGGKDIPVVMTKNIIDQARRTLDFTDQQLLYARVDGLVIDGQFYLMELELTEPYLFLETDKRAPMRFADAIHTCLIRDKKV